MGQHEQLPRRINGALFGETFVAILFRNLGHFHRQAAIGNTLMSDVVNQPGKRKAKHG